MRNSFFTKIFFVLAITIVAAYWVSGNSWSVMSYFGGVVEKKTLEPESLFDQTKMICFGRFVMQVPINAIIVYGPAEAEASIDYWKGEAGKIDEFISKKMAEVAQERKFLDERDLARLPLFGKVIDGVRPGQKTIIGSKDQVGYAIMSIFPENEDLFVLNVNGGMPEDNFLDRMNQVSSALRLRSAEEIPIDPGLCIDGAFVTGKYEFERATLGIRLKEFPDVHISVDTHKNLEFLNNDSNPKILHEQARELAEKEGLAAVFARGKIIREQIRHIGHWVGQEMAFRTPAYKRSVSAHEIRFYSAGSVNDPFHPQLDIRLNSGVKDNANGAVSPSVTDEEALYLWDKIVTTIRLREPSDATPKKSDDLPRSTHADTGQICPESGWWETSDKHIAEASRRRLLRAGDVMPYVEIPVSDRLWHKLFGTGHSKIAATWELVLHEDEPSKSVAVKEAASPSNQISDTEADHA